MLLPLAVATTCIHSLQEVLLATWLRTGQWLLPAALSLLDLQLFPLTAKLGGTRGQGTSPGGTASRGRGLGFMGGEGLEEGMEAVHSSVEEEVRRRASEMDDALLLTIGLKGCKVST